MERAIQTITQMPSTKDEQGQFFNQIKSDILSGFINPLDSLKALKSLEVITKSLMGDKEIKTYIQEEADKHTEKTIELGTCTVTKSERSTYDYADCGDSQWNEADEMVKKYTALKKAREVFLKAVKGRDCDPSTGEEVFEPKTKTSEILTVKFK